MKVTTAIPYKDWRAIGPAAVTLARAEGLDAHALSVALRLPAEDRPADLAQGGTA